MKRKIRFRAGNKPVSKEQALLEEGLKRAAAKRLVNLVLKMAKNMPNESPETNHKNDPEKDHS